MRSRPGAAPRLLPRGARRGGRCRHGRAGGGRAAGRRSGTTSRCASRRRTSAARSAAFARDGFAFDTGPSLLTLPAVYRDLFLKTGGAARGQPSTSSPVDPVVRATASARRRRPGWTCRTRRRARRARRARRRARRPAPATTGTAFLDRAPRHLAGDPRAVPRVAAGRRPRPAAAGPADRATCAPSRRGRRCAGWARATCATRGCACCSTATRPTPAPTRGGHRPRWRRCRTSSRRSAPGTSRGGLRRLGDARARPGAASAAPTCAPAADVARGPRRGRPGAGRPARRRRARAPPTSSSPNADATHALRRPAAADRAARRRPRAAAPGDAVAVRVRAAARAARPHARAARTTPCCSRRDYDAEFDAVFGRRRARAGRGPDGLRQRARRPGAAARRRPRVVVRAGQRAAARPTRHRAPSTGTRRGSPTAYADRVLDVMAAPRAGRARPGAVARGPHAGRPRARHPRTRRRDLRHVVATARAPRSCGRPTVSPVPGLFLVGGSAHPGGGLPLVGLSAAIVAGLVGPA